MIILGLDAATKKSGISIFDNTELIYYDKFEIKDKGLEPRDRMKLIYSEIKRLYSLYHFDTIIMEDVPINSNNNLAVGKNLSILQGMVFAFCEQVNIIQTLYAPSAWRSIIGTYDGTREGMKRENQKKKAVETVNNIYGLNLNYCQNDNKSQNSDDDIAEAILIARAYMKEVGLV